MFKIKYIPNSLTVTRILIVPFYIWLTFFVKTDLAYKLAFALFIIASLTDYLDGYLARKYNAITDFGKIMDPLADKIIVISAIGALASKNFAYINWWIFGIILFREMSVSILREVYAKKNIYIAANRWGKLKTFMQMTGIIAILFYHSFIKIRLSDNLNYSLSKVFLIYFWLTAIVTLLSGLNYFIIKRKVKR